MKRSNPLKRTTPLRNTKPLVRQTPFRATAKVPVLRPRMCEVCRVKFRPDRDNVTWCSPEHGLEVALRRVAAEEARKHREALANVKPLQHWLKLTEDAVNALVRIRDADLPCVSCDTWTTVQWQAGHYLSVGAHPELRFDLANIHKQCHRCNVALSGNVQQYRIRIEYRIGPAELARLESYHPPAKFTRESLALIRQTVNAEVRRLKKERAQ